MSTMGWTSSFGQLWAVQLVSLVIYTALFYALNEYIARRVLCIYPAITVFFGIVCMMVFSPLLLSLKTIGFYTFGQVLISSITLIVIDLYRYSRLNGITQIFSTIPLNPDLFNFVLYAFVQANIVFNSFWACFTFNYFTLFSGFILAATLPLPLSIHKKWDIGTVYNVKSNEFCDVIVSVDMYWIWLYTSWKLNFMYAQYKAQYIFAMLAIQIVPLCYAILHGNKKLWVSAHLYTMTIHFWLQVLTLNYLQYAINTNNFWIENKHQISENYIVNIWEITNFVFAVLYTLVLAKRLYAKNAVEVNRRNGSDEELIMDIEAIAMDNDSKSNNKQEILAFADVNDNEDYDIDQYDVSQHVYDHLLEDASNNEKDIIVKHN